MLRLIELIETQIDNEFRTVSYGRSREERKDANRTVRTEKTTRSSAFLSGSKNYFKRSD